MTDPRHNAFEQAATMSGKPSGFRSLVGYRAVRWERDYGEIELEINDDHLNSLGMLHGGVYMTLMDAAMGHAATWCAVPDHVRICVTLSLSTTFVSPVKAGRVRAIGRLEGINDRVGTVTAEVRDAAGILLATGLGSFRYMPGSDAYEGVPKINVRR